MIGLNFPDELFDEEAKKNTPGRIDRMMSEFEEWRNWDDLEKGRGIFPSNTYMPFSLLKNILIRIIKLL